MNAPVPVPTLPRARRLPRRARIGLALGSGAARGWAHLGVIRALADAGVRPDVVAGCSVGALVGGCLAAGRLDELEAFALSLTKRRILGLIDFQLQGAGLVGGERLRALLERDLADVSVERLPVTFASVATEMGTGHEVWMTKGSLVEAIRASYALPGLLEPVEADGRVLVDGALVNPIPVTLARALGADVVVCVNLNGDPRLRGAVIRSHGSEGAAPPAPGWLSRIGLRRAVAEAAERPLARVARPAGVLADAFNIAQDRIARSRLAGDPPDLMVCPRLAGIGMFEFHRAAESIALGRAAAERALPELLEVLAVHGALTA